MRPFSSARHRAGAVSTRHCRIRSVTDWQAWHGHYDDRDSSLSRRLCVVQQRLNELVSGEAGSQRVLSLCSGEGRDILPVLARLSNERRPEVILVELDPALAAAAERRAVDAGVAATVVVGDSGLAKTWQTVAPVSSPRAPMMGHRNSLSSTNSFAASAARRSGGYLRGPRRALDRPYRPRRPLPDISFCRNCRNCRYSDPADQIAVVTLATGATRVLARSAYPGGQQEWWRQAVTWRSAPIRIGYRTTPIRPPCGR